MEILRNLLEPSCDGAVSCFFTHNKDVITVTTGVLGSTVVILTFIFAVLQYRINQVWKRNEFLADKVEGFYGDDSVKTFFSMLDYHGKYFEAKIDGENIEMFVVHNAVAGNVKNGINVEDLGMALSYHEDMPQGISISQEYIRNLFDAYCSYLQQFAIFINNGLFTANELEPYIRYHIDILNGQINHSQGYHTTMFQYLVLYNQNWPLRLLAMFEQSPIVQNSIAQAIKRKQTITPTPPARA